jgi:hypothetical protein
VMINWGSLLVVQLVSIGATLAVATLVSLAVLGLSSRDAHGHAPATTSGRNVSTLGTLSARSGRIIGTTCIVLATAIVLFGLSEIVTR